MRRLLVGAIIAVSLSGNSALGWNDRGHMMVATIAWEYMEADTRERAADLLKLNPLYPSWVQSISLSKRDQVAFVRASTWADVIKFSTSGYKHDGSHPSESDAPDRNIGYDDKDQHRYWHYKDLPFSTDGTPLIQPAAPNAQTQIEKFRDTLASSTASDDVKSYDLVWLIHLVGDVHQPLHATQRFSIDLPKGDIGGNAVMLCDPDPVCNIPLHSFWDRGAGANASHWAAIASAEMLPDADPIEAAITDVGAWMQESFKIAKAFVYGPPVGAGAGPFHVTNTYRKLAREGEDTPPCSKKRGGPLCVERIAILTVPVSLL